MLIPREAPREQGEGSLRQAQPAADLVAADAPLRVKERQVHAEGNPRNTPDPRLLQLPCHEVGGHQHPLEQMAHAPHVGPRGSAQPGAEDPRSREIGTQDPGKVGVVEPDHGDPLAARGPVGDPGHREGTSHLDQIGSLLPDDLPNPTAREQKAIGSLAGHRGTFEPIPGHARTPGDAILDRRHHDGLAEVGMRLDVAGLFQQVGLDPAGRRAELLGDVEESERGVRATQRRRRVPLSRSSHPAGR
jgi:hypothetical protein